MRNQQQPFGGAGQLSSSLGRHQRRTAFGLMAFIGMAGFGCSGEEGSPAERNDATRPTHYAFTSRFANAAEGDVDSVTYRGQVQRQLQILALKDYIGGLDDFSYAAPTVEQVVADLNFFYDYGGSGGTGDTAMIGIDGDGQTVQQTFGDVGTPNSLREKMPENDVDFAGGVVGYADDTLAPDAVVQHLFTRLAENIVARSQGDIPQTPGGQDILSVYVIADGLDLRQLIQKFVAGAVAYSQGTDDYLDDDREGKGLLSDNTEASTEDGDGLLYTALEHSWDEAFGYFGAARDYGDYSDDEIAGSGGRTNYASGYFDSNGDGFIDLTSEYNFGHSVNAAKRDSTSAPGAAHTNFTKRTFDAFLAGRHLITTAGGALNADQQSALGELRNDLVGAWEETLAATVVHYMNEVLVDIGAFSVPCSGDQNACYDFVAHAKHFSELKGFALILQFNPRSALSGADFARLQNLIGPSPVLPNATGDVVEKAHLDLIAARTLIASTYGFDAANVGDDNGNGGW